MGFYLVPFCQPNPPMRFLSITSHWNASLPSGASLWNGMFGRVEGQYTTSSCMNRASVCEWHKRFKEGRESVRDDERCGMSKEVNTPELIGQRVRAIMFRF